MAIKNYRMAIVALPIILIIAFVAWLFYATLGEGVSCDDNGCGTFLRVSKFPYGNAIEDGVARIQFCARQHLSRLDQREALHVPPTPRRRYLRGVVPPIAGAAEAFVPHRVAMV